MNIQGKVVSVSGDFAEVLFVRTSACGENCASCGLENCRKNHIACVKNPFSAEIGDTVNVFLSDRASYSALALTFLLPAFLFILAYISVLVFFDSHALAAIVSALVTACYFFILKRFETKIAPQPEIIEVIRDGKDEANGS